MPEVQGLVIASEGGSRLESVYTESSGKGRGIMRRWYQEVILGKAFISGSRARTNGVHRSIKEANRSYSCLHLSMVTCTAQECSYKHEWLLIRVIIVRTEFLTIITSNILMVMNFFLEKQ